MAQYGFYFDGTRCTGCKTCVLSCKDKKDLADDQAFRNVFEYEGSAGWTCDEAGCWTCGSFTYYVTSGCNHCENPACVAACPTGAMVKDPRTGLVNNDREVCVGCGACAQACPYGAPVLDADLGKVRKCDGCVERLDQGRAPVCVAACPSRALEFGLLDDLREKYGDCAAVAPLCDPSLTGPSVVIKAPHNAVAWDSDAGFVVNQNEIC